MKKRKVLFIRLDAERKRIFQKEADRQRISLTDYFRRLADKLKSEGMYT
ncbi:MAG: hypothetical protein GY862_12950 [Gammaproteobacteria bacterium]|nr:hypothetical protein [Gammaproteobacteria bacterium]